MFTAQIVSKIENNTQKKKKKGKDSIQSTPSTFLKQKNFLKFVLQIYKKPTVKHDAHAQAHALPTIKPIETPNFENPVVKSNLTSR